MKFEIREDKVIVQEKLEKSVGRVKKVTTADVKAFLRQNDISFKECLSGDVVVSDDETKLCGTWIFSLSVPAEKLSTKKQILDLPQSEVSVHAPPAPSSETTQNVRKKRTQKVTVLVPSEGE